jgi:HlyD family secretion protein
MLAATALSVFLVAGIGGWAAQAKLAGAVISHGEVVVSGETKQVQHVDGGTIVAIPVKVGDLVRKGDVLLKLDETQIGIELSIVRDQIGQLTAMRARLLAERDGRSSLDLSGLSLAPDMAAEETKLFSESLRLRENQKQQISFQIDQLQNQIAGLEEQRDASVAEDGLLQSEASQQEKLVSGGLAKTAELRDLKRQLVRIKGTIGNVSASIAEAKGQISELQVKLVSIDQNGRSEAQKELVATEGRLSELKQRGTALEHRLARATVRAPETGYIYDLQAHTIGGVVTPGQVIMSIVPQDSELKVDVKVSPVDIDRVSLGQAARMRFTTFNRRTTPEIAGSVELISAATLTDRATNSSYYKTSISFAPGDLGALSEKLAPGMPVEVYIETEERTVISYLAKPFMDQAMKGFREE